MKMNQQQDQQKTIIDKRNIKQNQIYELEDYQDEDQDTFSQQNLEQQNIINHKQKQQDQSKGIANLQMKVRKKDNAQDFTQSDNNPEYFLQGQECQPSQYQLLQNESIQIQNNSKEIKQQMTDLEIKNPDLKNNKQILQIPPLQQLQQNQFKQSIKQTSPPNSNQEQFQQSNQIEQQGFQKQNPLKFPSQRSQILYDQYDQITGVVQQHLIDNNNKGEEGEQESQQNEESEQEYEDNNFINNQIQLQTGENNQIIDIQQQYQKESMSTLNSNYQQLESQGDFQEQNQKYDEQQEMVVCSKCQMCPSNYIELNCQHSFCLKCMANWFIENQYLTFEQIIEVPLSLSDENYSELKEQLQVNISCILCNQQTLLDYDSVEAVKEVIRQNIQSQNNQIMQQNDFLNQQQDTFQLNDQDDQQEYQQYYQNQENESQQDEQIIDDLDTIIPETQNQNMLMNNQQLQEMESKVSGQEKIINKKKIDEQFDLNQINQREIDNYQNFQQQIDFDKVQNSQSDKFQQNLQTDNNQLQYIQQEQILQDQNLQNKQIKKKQVQKKSPVVNYNYYVNSSSTQKSSQQINQLLEQPQEQYSNDQYTLNTDLQKPINLQQFIQCGSPNLITHSTKNNEIIYEESSEAILSEETNRDQNNEIPNQTQMNQNQSQIEQNFIKGSMSSFSEQTDNYDSQNCIQDYENRFLNKKGLNKFIKAKNKNYHHVNSQESFSNANSSQNNSMPMDTNSMHIFQKKNQDYTSFSNSQFNASLTPQSQSDLNLNQQKIIKKNQFPFNELFQINNKQSHLVSPPNMQQQNMYMLNQLQFGELTHSNYSGESSSHVEGSTMSDIQKKMISKNNNELKGNSDQFHKKISSKTNPQLFQTEKNVEGKHLEDVLEHYGEQTDDDEEQQREYVNSEEQYLENFEYQKDNEEEIQNNVEKYIYEQELQNNNQINQIDHDKVKSSKQNKQQRSNSSKKKIKDHNFDNFNNQQDIQVDKEDSFLLNDQEYRSQKNQMQQYYIQRMNIENENSQQAQENKQYKDISQIKQSQSHSNQHQKLDQTQQYNKAKIKEHENQSIKQKNEQNHQILQQSSQNKKNQFKKDNIQIEMHNTYQNNQQNEKQIQLQNFQSQNSQHKYEKQEYQYQNNKINQYQTDKNSEDDYKQNQFEINYLQENENNQKIANQLNNNQQQSYELNQQIQESQLQMNQQKAQNKKYMNLQQNNQKIIQNNSKENVNQNFVKTQNTHKQNERNQNQSHDNKQNIIEQNEKKEQISNKQKMTKQNLIQQGNNKQNDVKFQNEIHPYKQQQQIDNSIQFSDQQEQLQNKLLDSQIQSSQDQNQFVIEQSMQSNGNNSSNYNQYSLKNQSQDEVIDNINKSEDNFNQQQYQEIGINLKPYCDDHPYEELGFFSFSQNKCLCIKCIQKGDFMSEDVTNFQRGQELLLEKVEQSTHQINVSIEFIKLATKRQEEQHRKRVEKADLYKILISQQIQQIIQKLEEKLNQLLSEAEDFAKISEDIFNSQVDQLYNQLNIIANIRNNLSGINRNNIQPIPKFFQEYQFCKNSFDQFLIENEDILQLSNPNNLSGSPNQSATKNWTNINQNNILQQSQQDIINNFKTDEVVSFIDQIQFLKNKISDLKGVQIGIADSPLCKSNSRNQKSPGVFQNSKGHQNSNINLNNTSINQKFPNISSNQTPQIQSFIHEEVSGNKQGYKDSKIYYKSSENANRRLSSSQKQQNVSLNQQAQSYSLEPQQENSSIQVQYQEQIPQVIDQYSYNIDQYQINPHNICKIDDKAVNLQQLLLQQQNQQQQQIQHQKPQQLQQSVNESKQFSNLLQRQFNNQIQNQYHYLEKDRIVDDNSTYSSQNQTLVNNNSLNFAHQGVPNTLIGQANPQSSLNKDFHNILQSKNNQQTLQYPQSLIFPQLDEYTKSQNNPQIQANINSVYSQQQQYEIYNNSMPYQNLLKSQSMRNINEKQLQQMNIQNPTLGQISENLILHDNQSPSYIFPSQFNMNLKEERMQQKTDPGNMATIDYQEFQNRKNSQQQSINQILHHHKYSKSMSHEQNNMNPHAISLLEGGVSQHIASVSDVSRSNQPFEDKFLKFKHNLAKEINNIQENYSLKRSSIPQVSIPQKEQLGVDLFRKTNSVANIMNTPQQSVLQSPNRYNFIKESSQIDNLINSAFPQIKDFNKKILANQNYLNPKIAQQNNNLPINQNNLIHTQIRQHQFPRSHFNSNQMNSSTNLNNFSQELKNSFCETSSINNSCKRNIGKKNDISMITGMTNNNSAISSTALLNPQLFNLGQNNSLQKQRQASHGNLHSYSYNNTSLNNYTNTTHMMGNEYNQNISFQGNSTKTQHNNKNSLNTKENKNQGYIYKSLKKYQDLFRRQKIMFD